MPPISRTHAFVLNNEGNYSPAGTSNTNAIANNIVNDVEVADPPGDSMAALSFSPQADFLAVGSWDNQVSCLIWILDGRVAKSCHTSRSVFMR